jgi:hypothetical protein
VVVKTLVPHILNSGAICNGLLLVSIVAVDTNHRFGITLAASSRYYDLGSFVLWSGE